MVIIIFLIDLFYGMTRKGKTPGNEPDPDDILAKVAKRLKSLRIGQGYSNYEKFAHDKDLPRSQYGKYERGEDLRLTSLDKVVKAFGITMKEFFSEGFD
jgi:hypothetical protein